MELLPRLSEDYAKATGSVVHSDKQTNPQLSKQEQQIKSINDKMIELLKL
ncbi:Hypothetical protein FKW44_012672 [Caligus rogercresseyi]|uniref:Uncharacterized protein n=1 Tax=Caligus rogercresseyi TaxID=217165 RepID=A0A7T8HKB0_CALRO|nr:Hypothetical protein FKW44_012672 [Caligus rogercresseyi]